MKKFWSLAFIVINCMLAYGEVELDEFGLEYFSRLEYCLRQIPRRIQIYKKADPEPNDLAVGYFDPNEIMTIEGDYYLNGDLYIVNNGVLRLNQADFKINGNILIMGNGVLHVNGGKFTVVQEYIYEHDCMVIQAGKLDLSDVDFQSGGQSWSVTIADSAEYILKNCRISNGFITTALVGKSRGIIHNSELPGEFLCMGNNFLEFQGCDQLLMWFVLPDTAVVDISLPDDSLLTDFYFSDTCPNVTNIPYSISIDSCTQVLWGAISQSGSDATFRDSKLRTIGLYFMHPDSIAVSNITNESNHVDELVQVPDRDLRLINSEVMTWSFYTARTSNISIINCIFGELITMDSSKALVYNSVCDGTGGYLGVFQNSFVLVVGSLIRTQVISREFGILMGVYSAFTGPEIDADESSVMLIANTAIFTEPESHGSALIFESQVLPFEGETNREIPVTGTIRIIKGPLNPIQFLGYQIKYQYENEWEYHNMGPFHSEPVIHDTLTIWNTVNLEPGNYRLLVEIHHSFGDSIAIGSYARLDQAEEGVSRILSDPKISILKQNFPNPFNSMTVIPFTLSKPSPVALSIYDISGREIGVLIDREMGAGEYLIDFKGDNLPGGVYFYRLVTNTFSETKRLLLIK